MDIQAEEEKVKRWRTLLRENKLALLNQVEILYEEAYDKVTNYEKICLSRLKKEKQILKYS